MEGNESYDPLLGRVTKRLEDRARSGSSGKVPQSGADARPQSQPLAEAVRNACHALNLHDVAAAGWLYWVVSTTVSDKISPEAFKQYRAKQAARKERCTSNDVTERTVPARQNGKPRASSNGKKRSSGKKGTHESEPNNQRRDSGMYSRADGVHNPRRVAASRRNRRKRKGLTPKGRQRLSESARRHKPWLHATGPKTARGKLRSSQNGKLRQTDDVSCREVRRELEDTNRLLGELATLRRQLLNREASG